MEDKDFIVRRFGDGDHHYGSVSDGITVPLEEFLNNIPSTHYLRFICALDHATSDVLVVLQRRKDAPKPRVNLTGYTDAMLD